MTAPIDTVRDRLEKVKGSSTKFMACCPAHEDKNPSLSVKENEHGDVLMNCFAGCKPMAVVSAIGLEMKDLYNMPLPKPNGNGSRGDVRSFLQQNSLTRRNVFTMPSNG